MRDADDLAAGFLVGLGAAQMEQQTARFGLEVSQGERGELGAAQGAGEADQDQRGVADTADGGAVDGGDDLAQVGHTERAGRAAWGAADNPAQPAPDLADRVVVDRVRDAMGAVLVPDGRAGRVDGGKGEALLGAPGQVGADRGGLGRERHDPATGAPAHPTAPGERVDLARGLGVRGGESLGDAGRVVLGESDPRIGGRNRGRVDRGEISQGSERSCHRRVVARPSSTPESTPLPGPGPSRASDEKRE